MTKTIASFIVANTGKLRCLALAAALAQGTCAYAQTVGVPIEVGADAVYAIPIKTTLPSVPFPIPKPGETIEILLTGRVLSTGKMTDPTFHARTEHRVYVDALATVLPDWRFRPAIDAKKCDASEREQSLLVWFEERQGKAVLSVSRFVGDSDPRGKEPPADNLAGSKANTSDLAKGPLVKLEWALPPDLVYQPRTRDGDIEGLVTVFLLVDPSGELKRWFIPYSPHPLLTKWAVGMLGKTKFKSWAEASDNREPICVQLPIAYCLPEPPAKPDPACTDQRRPAG